MLEWTWESYGQFRLSEMSPSPLRGSQLLSCSTLHTTAKRLFYSTTGLSKDAVWCSLITQRPTISFLFHSPVNYVGVLWHSYWTLISPNNAQVINSSNKRKEFFHLSRLKVRLVATQPGLDKHSSSKEQRLSGWDVSSTVAIPLWLFHMETSWQQLWNAQSKTHTYLQFWLKIKVSGHLNSMAELYTIFELSHYAV